MSKSFVLNLSIAFVLLIITPDTFYGQYLPASTNASLVYLKKLRNNSSDSALPYANQLMKEAIAQKDNWLATEITLEMARIYFAKNDQQTSLTFSQQAENTSTIKNQAYFAAPQFSAFLLNRMGKSDEALQKLFVCLKNAETAGAKKMLSSINISISDVYRESRNSAKGLVYAADALKIAGEMNDTAQLIFAYSNLGNIYSNSDYRTDKNLDTAIFFYKKAMAPTFVKKWFNPYDSARHFKNMGRLYRLNKEFDIAGNYLSTALGVAERRDFKGLKQEALNEQMTLAMEQNNIPKAIEIKKIFAAALPNSEISLQREKDFTQKSEDLAIETGNYKDAYTSLKEEVILKDSLYNIDKQKAIVEIEKKYESDTKVLKAMNIAQKEAYERNLIIGLSLLIIGLLFSLFMWSNYKKRKQTEFLKTLILEVNHRTKNNLQMLSALVATEQQPERNSETNAAVKKLNSYIKSFGMMYENLSSNSSFDTVNLSEYVAEVSNSAIAGSKAQELKLDFKTTENIEIPTDKAILMGLIVNELITNSIKHAFGGNQQNTITISLYKEDATAFALQYEDNGKGQLQNTAKAGSFGVNMIQQMVKQMNGYLVYDVVNTKRVNIYIPAT
jgi:two-component sensor histidine kinase